jgi:hypothetical protein
MKRHISKLLNNKKRQKSDPPSECPPINDTLPIEILQMIISKLEKRGDWKSVISTCKKWRDIGVNTFTPTQSDLTDALLMRGKEHGNENVMSLLRFKGAISLFVDGLSTPCCINSPYYNDHPNKAFRSFAIKENKGKNLKKLINMGLVKSRCCENYCILRNIIQEGGIHAAITISNVYNKSIDKESEEVMNIAKSHIACKYLSDQDFIHEIGERKSRVNAMFLLEHKTSTELFQSFTSAHLNKLLLLAACEKKDLRIVNMILDYKYKDNHDDLVSLRMNYSYAACVNGHWDSYNTFERMIKDGFRPNSYMSCILSCKDKKSMDCVISLLSTHIGYSNTCIKSEVAGLYQNDTITESIITTKRHIEDDHCIGLLNHYGNVICDSNKTRILKFFSENGRWDVVYHALVALSWGCDAIDIKAWELFVEKKKPIPLDKLEKIMKKHEKCNCMLILPEHISKPCSYVDWDVFQYMMSSQPNKGKIYPKAIAKSLGSKTVKWDNEENKSNKMEQIKKMIDFLLKIPEIKNCDYKFCNELIRSMSYRRDEGFGHMEEELINYITEKVPNTGYIPKNLELMHSKSLGYIDKLLDGLYRRRDEDEIIKRDCGELLWQLCELPETHLTLELLQKIEKYEKCLYVGNHLMRVALEQTLEHDNAKTMEILLRLKTKIGQGYPQKYKIYDMACNHSAKKCMALLFKDKKVMEHFEKIKSNM